MMTAQNRYPVFHMSRCFWNILPVFIIPQSEYSAHVFLTGVTLFYQMCHLVTFAGIVACLNRQFMIVYTQVYKGRACKGRSNHKATRRQEHGLGMETDKLLQLRRMLRSGGTDQGQPDRQRAAGQSEHAVPGRILLQEGPRNEVFSAQQESS